VGVICLPVGVQPHNPPPPPANFYPGCSGNKIYVVPKITNKSVTLAELLDVKNRIKQTGLQMIRKWTVFQSSDYVEVVSSEETLQSEKLAMRSSSDAGWSDHAEDMYQSGIVTDESGPANAVFMNILKCYRQVNCVCVTSYIAFDLHCVLETIWPYCDIACNL